MRNDQEEILLYFLSHTLFGSIFSLDKEYDWNTIYRESVAHAVTALVYDAIPEGTIPPDVNAAWKNAVNSVYRRNIRVEAEHIELHRLLIGNSIPYVTLKGCASAMYYPNPFLRTLGDVDFLIRPEDVDRADKLLRANGFTYKPSSNTDERVYVRGKSVWELHTAANGTPGGETGKKIRALMSDAIEKATVYKVPSPDCEEGGLSPQSTEERGVSSRDWKLQAGDSFLIPSEFHHGLVLLLHTARHMTTGGVGLRHICDWAVFAAHVGDRFSEMFEKKLRSVGLWKFACVLTQLASEYLGAPTQKWAGEPDRALLEALIDDIFAGGNFGVKDKSRRDQAKLITDRKSGGAASRSTAGQSVRSANEIVRHHWPVAGKLPVLYPAGWVFFGGRYAVRTLVGKRKKLDLTGIAKSAKYRREIYNKLELFK